jgi:hypothetical protein
MFSVVLGLFWMAMGIDVGLPCGAFFGVAVSGGSWVVKLQDSTADSGYGDLSGGAFTAATGATSQRLVAATENPEATYAALRKRQPMGDLVSCETVADAVVYLAAATTFTTGIDLLVDGGISGIRIVDAS